MQRIYTVWAKWDDEAKVWYVEQSDIPGLVTEAPTAEQFVKHITELAGDLIYLNPDEESFQFLGINACPAANDVPNLWVTIEP